jgi:hypothetical protein
MLSNNCGGKFLLGEGKHTLYQALAPNRWHRMDVAAGNGVVKDRKCVKLY